MGRVPEGAFSPLESQENEGGVFEEVMKDPELKEMIESLVELRNKYIDVKRKKDGESSRVKYVEEKTGGVAGRLKTKMIPDLIAILLDNAGSMLAGSGRYNSMNSIQEKKRMIDELPEMRGDLKTLKKEAGNLEKELEEKSIELQKTLEEKGLFEKLRAEEEGRLKAHIEERGL